MKKGDRLRRRSPFFLRAGLRKERLQTSLAAAEASSAALGLAASGIALVASAASTPTEASTATAEIGEVAGLRTKVLARRARTGGRTSRTVLGLVDIQIAAGQLRAVVLLDRLSGLFGGGEFNKREAAGTTRGAVRWQVHIHDLAGSREVSAELVLGGLKVQVADEDFGGNGCSPCRFSQSVPRAPGERSGLLFSNHAAGCDPWRRAPRSVAGGQDPNKREWGVTSECQGMREDRRVVTEQARGERRGRN